MLACDADSVNCQAGRRQRRESCSATAMASSVGSMNWAPAATRRCTARTTGSGSMPPNVLLSPMLVSRKRRPSAQVKWAPWPSATHTGGWAK